MILRVAVFGILDKLHRFFSSFDEVVSFLHIPQCFIYNRGLVGLELPRGDAIREKLVNLF